MNQSIFKAGNQITSPLEQIPNNLIFDNTYYERADVVYSTTSILSNISDIFDMNFNRVLGYRENIHNVFIVRIIGNSMIEAKINNGDILLVDCSTQAVDNSVIVAEINNIICVKKIRFIKNQFVLMDCNKNYVPIPITKEDNFLVWGVVRTKLNIM